MNFNKVLVKIKGGVGTAEPVGDGVYKYNDVTVKIVGNEISVTGGDTPIYTVECSAENTYFNNARILGDEWERAYGDLCWHEADGSKHPWYFAANDGEKTYCFGVKTLPDALCSWRAGNDVITLEIDVRNGTEPICLRGNTVNACTVVEGEYTGDTFDAVSDFCRAMCTEPRVVDRPIFGGNDWYCCYGENSFDKIMTHAKRVVECSKGLKYKPYMVIDDGWEICHHASENDYEYYNGGPWQTCNRNFKDMKKTAESIEEIGAIPGIWFRPLWTVEKFAPEHYLKHDGVKYTLDPSVPEVLEQVKSDVRCIKNWGFKLIKHDFSTFDIFGGFGDKDIENAKSVIFFDKTKTTAQIIKGLYYAIREAAGEDVLIMGCNTMSHLSAGIFDLQRTGDDTSGLDWERTKKYGINTLAFRMPQHKSFYLADADCVGITNKIEWSKNKKWLDVLAKSGTPLFVSIAEDAYTDEIKSDITKAFKINSETETVSRPLDWMDNIRPEKWKSECGTDEYDWE